MPKKDKQIDPFTNIDYMPVQSAAEAENSANNGAVFLSQLRELNVGQGGDNVFRADSSGFWAGAKTFDTAPFSVSMAGVLTASSIIVTGGTIKYGKTSFSDNTNGGYYIGAEGIYIGEAADLTYLKYTLATGLIDYVGTISGRETSTLASAINASGTLTTDLINARLDTATKEILGDFTFGVSGAIKMITDADNGLWLSPTGILGKKAGISTFAIDTAGNATFAGDITGATGTFGNVTITTGSISWSTISGVGTPADNADVTADNPQAVSWLTDAGALAVLDAVDLASAQVTNKVLDNIADGATYSRVLASDISAGHILLSAASGSLDDIANGSTYGKVLNTSISAGLILLSQVSGNLDDIANGSTYGKVALTGISAGKIVVAGLDSGVTGRMFADGTAKTTIEGWRHASDTTLIDGGDIYTGSITASKISVTSLSAISADLGTITAGTISGITFNVASAININNGATNVMRITTDAFIARENKAFAAESSSSGVYTQFYTAGLNGIMEITNNTSGSYGIKDDDSSEYLMKWTYYDVETWRTILPMVSGIDLGSATYKFDDVYCATMKGLYGEIYLDQVGRIQVTNHFDPSGTGSYNLGGASRYWADVSYKTLTDRGCLGWFDEGVELADGRIVSDIEAIKAIKKHPTKKTIYGKPMLDYKTLPKVCYKPAADHDGKMFDRDKNDNPYTFENGKKVIAQDGAEMTALFSIMLGSFKELDNRLSKIESAINKEKIVL